MFTMFNTNGADERLKRALADQEAEDKELQTILTSADIPQAKINTIIASNLCRIRVAQVYQNHNSTLVAERLRLLNINLLVVMSLVLAHLLWGQQLTAQAIIAEIAKILFGVR